MGGISIREIRTISVITAVCAFFAFAPSAFAQAPGTPAISSSPDVGSADGTGGTADAGEPITFTDNTGDECPPADAGQPYVVHRFYIDDETAPRQTRSNLEQNAKEYTTTFATAGTHTVRVEDDYPTCQQPHTTTNSLTFTLHRPLTGMIDASPGQPAPNQQTTFSVTPDGGYPGYTYAWNADDDGPSGYNDGTSYSITKTFTTTGPHTVHVRISDSQGHSTTVDKTVDVENPPADQPPPPPPPPPAPCQKEIHFALSQFRTDGCFAQTGSNPDVYTTRDTVKLNGITFPSFGQTFTIVSPSNGDGGHFTAPNSAIQLDNFKAFSGDIDWTLPTGGPGDAKVVKSLDIAAGAQILGLNVRGKVAVKLGVDKRDPNAKPGDPDKYFASFPLTIELPGGFRAGPDTDYGRVTGSASLRVDDDGIKYDGLQLNATNVWIGKVKVESVCFSYIPAGGTLASCPQPSFDGTGTPYITCKSDSSTDRWDGNAVVKFPSASGNAGRLGAFGGLANGQLANLGATVAPSGNGIPIAPSVSVTSLSFGLCLIPPPLQIKGSIGVGVLPTPEGSTVGFTGSVLYTDGTIATPWSLQISGGLSVFSRNLGNGYVTIHAYNGFDFGVSAKADLYGIVSFGGNIDGWVDANRNTFNVSGGIYGCVGGKDDGLCANGSAVVSDTGIGGCVTVVSHIPSPDLLVTFDPLSVRFADSTTAITAGFGYRWKADWPDLFAGSCNMTPYTSTRSFARAAAAGGTTTQRIAKGTNVASLLVHGTHGTPKVVVHGPDGTRIVSPSKGISATRKGRWTLVENKPQGTTAVLLIKPKPGIWRIGGVRGAKSQPTAVNLARSEAPPTFGAKVTAAGDKRVLRVVYATPRGTSLSLVERGAKGATRTLAQTVRGHRCAGAPASRPGTGQRVLCATVRFTPTRGPGGKRTVQAIVTRGRIPVAEKAIATFTAPAERRPSRPGALRARRANGFLVVAFPRSTGASRYAVSASLSDGRELGFDLAGKCRAVKIANVPNDVSAVVMIGGVRYDLVSGAKRSVKVPANVTTVGPKGKLPRRLWKPRLACS